jgi:putative SOS response-associated peptidase YedK
VCYSSLIRAAYHDYLRFGGAQIDIQDFARLYGLRIEGGSAQVPRVLEAWFEHPATEGERRIKALIDGAREARIERLEREIGAARERLERAEARLAVKFTRTAANEQRVAGNLIDQKLRRIARERSGLTPEDGRIWAMDWAPIIVHEAGQGLRIRLARYHLRRAQDRPESDVEKPGRYNARRDNLTRYWREQFGRRHAIVLWERFFENVPVAGRTRRELSFGPGDGGLMYVACLYDEWRDPADPDNVLVSFAAITDDPPAEVRQAGHDRCPVRLTPDAALRWLQPEGCSDVELLALLDGGRERAPFEWREVA